MRIRLGQESVFRRLKFGSIITARKQVTIAVCRERNRRMAQSLLDYLKRQFEAAISTSVDAPRGIEMSKRV
jgi:hypothetical protein